MKLVNSLVVAVLSLTVPQLAAAQPPSTAPAAPAAAAPGAKGPGAKGPGGGHGKPGKHAGGMQAEQAVGGDAPDPKSAGERMNEQATRMRDRAAKLRAEGRDKLAEKFEEKAKAMAEKSKSAGSAEAGDSGQAVRKKTREGRKRNRLKRLFRRYGDSLNTAEVTAELQQHAKRSARLRRMKVLARAADDQELVKRINTLIMREHRRHNRHMSKVAKRVKPDKKMPKKEPPMMEPESAEPAEKEETP